MLPIDIESYYEKYFPMVFRRCRQMLGNEEDALDAAQNVFLHLINAQKKLHGQFPSSLLYTMATNLCLNLLRNKKHVLPLCDNGKIVNNNNEFEQLEAKIVMDAIFLTESESIRAICFMYYADGMTLKEIGETIGLSISGVRKRIMEFNKRALKKLNKENTL